MMLIKNLAVMITVVSVQGGVSGCTSMRSRTAAPSGPDWRGGLLESRASASDAPLGPVDADRAFFTRVRDLDSRGELADRGSAEELQTASEGISQVMLAAAAYRLFQAGVFYGEPRLMQMACGMADRVVHVRLRRARSLEDLEGVCGALARGPSSDKGRCAKALASLHQGYQHLAQADEAEARRVTAEGLRFRADCEEARPLVRTPVDPASKGFLVVALLQAMDAPSATYLASEGPPRPARSINEAFIQNVQILGG